ncbi:hypothetical protein [Streptomyces sp. NPDC001410]|uniref:hypothetical protein n=1 Tax=Streptomyces sp. NPDC001410 TaxID=3364574 RepID=UPI0036776253
MPMVRRTLRSSSLSSLAQSKGPEDVVDDHGGDGREPVVCHGLLADQQVGVGSQGPASVAVAAPVGGEGVGEFVQVDGVRQIPPDRQTTASEVEIGQEEAAGLTPAETVDGDERDGELRHRRAGLVDQAAESVGGDGHGVIAQIIRRHISAHGTVPICVRYDLHEKVWSEPLPYLFQNMHAGGLRAMSTTTMWRMIRRAPRDWSTPIHGSPR